MAEHIQAVRGMNDLLPRDSGAWLAIEEIFRQWLDAYGYQHIRTPILEETRLFCRSIGEATDIVEKEMYSFTDRLNGEALTLRPEGTASCLRAVIQHGLTHRATQRLWYLGPMFRHERPQKGRYRQFHQLGIEALGFLGPDVDIEMIVMLADLWQRLGISQSVRLELNTLGQSHERAAHRQALIDYLESHREVLDEDAIRRLYTNPLRVLDSKNPAMQEICERAPRLLDYLETDSRAHYDAWRDGLTQAGISFVENPRLVRGLDYYNLSVFEWVTEALGAQGTVCGGGRYDRLVEQLGGTNTPAIGCAMGIERLMLLLEAQKLLPETQAPDIYLVHQGEGVFAYALQIAQTLRAQSLRVIQHMGGGSFKSQMKKADASGAVVAIILGENELNAQAVNVKALRDGQFQTQTFACSELNAVIEWIERLKKGAADVKL